LGGAHCDALKCVEQGLGYWGGVIGAFFFGGAICDALTCVEQGLVYRERGEEGVFWGGGAICDALTCVEQGLGYKGGVRRVVEVEGWGWLWWK